jgi:hypothetical protein
MRQPTSDHEWQEAVDLAEGALSLHDARLYGLVTGGPAVNVARCREILRLGAARGIHPAPNAVERFITDTEGGRAN